MRARRFPRDRSAAPRYPPTAASTTAGSPRTPPSRASTTTAGATMPRRGSGACTRAPTLHRANDDFNVAATLADNHLEGTQALPVSMLANPQQAYTWPDTHRKQARFLQRQLAARVRCEDPRRRQCVLPAAADPRHEQQRQRRVRAARATVRGVQPALGGDHRVLGRIAAGDLATDMGGNDPSDRRRRRLRCRHHRLRAERAAGDVRP